ncbi:MAG: PASTA domain-containing protein [Candidatus Hydrogenedens sp.]|nr:PASTA domain-containing protein [Candidatus Hydrogenedens sp.]
MRPQRNDERPTDPYGGPIEARQQRRSHAVLFLLMAGFVVLLGRLAQLHLSPDLELSEEERRHIGKIVLSAPRGVVYDRNGLVLATNDKVASLWADPRKTVNGGIDVAEIAMKASALIDMEADEIMDRMTKRDNDGDPRKFMWVKRWLVDVPAEPLQALIEESEGALAIRMEPVRYYPQGETAAHLMGFVNRAGEPGDGVELRYNKLLDSTPGEHLARKDGSRRLLESLTLDYTPPTGGESIQLTLDTAIQHSLEEALDRRIVETNAKSGMGILMDPKTGAILAMASRPTFNPNHYADYDPSLWKNRAVLDVFEPGSAFKIVVASAALEHGIVTPETRINCEGGSFNPYGHRVKDFHKMGVEPFTKCFAESSNIAMIKLAAQLGPERFDEWVRRYGFGRTTSPDFQYEQNGLYRPREQWSKLSMGSLPMGQEIAVTMPQLARAFAVVANGGVLVEPYFVERSISRDGVDTQIHDVTHRERILSERTSDTMRHLCKLVVEEGTGEYAKMDEYTAGGKTGTAQMKRIGGPGYDPNRFTTVFAGFAPIEDPAVVCVIVIAEPMIKLHYGGYVCGPVFKEVVREALVRLGVPMDKGEHALPEREKPAPRMVVAQAEPIEDADTLIERLDEKDVAELEESLEDLLEPLDGLELVASATDSPQGPGQRLPDFTGWTKRQVREKLLELGVPWDVHGAGWVVSQYPPAGTLTRDVMVCSLEFSGSTAGQEQEGETETTEDAAIES